MWYLSFPFFCSNSSNSWWITKVLLFHSLEWSLIFLSVGFSIMAEKWLLAHSLIPKSFFLRKKKPSSLGLKASGALQDPQLSFLLSAQDAWTSFAWFGFCFHCWQCIEVGWPEQHGHSTQWSLNQSCPDSPGRRVQVHPSGIQSQAPDLGLWESHF